MVRISRVHVSNFRNLGDVEISLGPGAVIVGENRAGKSNLLHALRLVLDPSMSYRDLQLQSEDFHGGLSDGSDDWDPFVQGCSIKVSVEIVDFANDPRLLTALADCLVEADPPRARISYKYAPLDKVDEAGEIITGHRDYQGSIFGGENEDSHVSRELRRYLHLEFLGALRDVESDIRGWRDSPLRQLLEAAASAVPETSLTEVKEAMKKANDELNGLDQIRDLGNNISTRILDMVGQGQALETQLAAAPDEPLRLIRGMRLFVDGDAKRALGSASLGALNVLYFALLELGLAVKLADAEFAHVVMAIEEPEAHLHPHLQRLIFKRLLAAQSGDQTVLVTTQSPHIASVADPRSLVVLRSREGVTFAASASDAQLEEAEWDDMRRYLDATRAELVFARRVLLVEGFAEQVLLSSLAESIGMDLDKNGITVCAIHGTHFKAYARFCAALQIPWAIVTDGDAYDETTGLNQGQARAAALMDALDLPGEAPDNGIFVGGTTFEFDLVTSRPGNVAPCFETLSSLCAAPSRKKIASWGLSVPDYDQFMTMVENAGGKGRYAQRLSLTPVEPPPHLEAALRYLADQ